jgi:hypothetical protein
MGPTSPQIYRPTPRQPYPNLSYIDPQYHGSSPQQAPWLYLFIVFWLICINASLTKIFNYIMNFIFIPFIIGDKVIKY